MVDYTEMPDVAVNVAAVEGFLAVDTTDVWSVAGLRDARPRPQPAWMSPGLN